MISRSDGETFHLVLADRPLPYPIERSAGPTRRISVCLCYCHIGRSAETYCSIVILRASQTNRPSIFRMIETVAAMLAAGLSGCGRLDGFYEFLPGSANPTALKRS
jgi:hypothetical protein